MPKLALLPIGAFIIWAYVCQQWYVCSIKQKCGPEADSTIAVVDTSQVQQAGEQAPAVNTYPLGFKWNSSQPEKGPGFDARFQQLIDSLPKDYLFEIVGKYYGDETPPQGYSNMGLARADAVKKMFTGKIDSSRIVVTSRMIGSVTPEAQKTSYLDGISFNYKEVPKGNEVEFIEIENQISILFPYGSAQREADPRVDEYIEKLAQRLKQTNETVSITGHTDSSGSEEYNEKLGLARARHIEQLLISKGIDKSRITIASKGEKEPVASNDTEEGRRQNRRVVLVINKPQ